MSNKFKVLSESEWVPGLHDDDGMFLNEFLELTSPIVEQDEHDCSGTVYEVAWRHRYPTPFGQQSRLMAVAYAEVVAGPAGILSSEHATAVAWKILCDTVLFSKVARFGGRVATDLEAAAIVEFSSAVGAVRWARDVQTMIMQPNATSKTEGLRLRVAIGIGEVVREQKQFHLHCTSNDPRSIKQFGRPGGIVLSALVHDLVKPHEAWGGAVVEQADASAATGDDDACVYLLN